MKENLINKLVETFKSEAENYSNTLEGVLNYKCEEFFKKNNPEKGYHSIDASIIFKEFTLKLEYKINISMLIPKSTIEMRFMFEQGKLPVEYSMYDVLNVIDKNNFNCYTFGYVTSEVKMKKILKYLIDTFNTYKEKIEKLSLNTDKIGRLEKDIEENIEVLLNEKIFESRDAFYLMHMLELYYALDISRVNAFTMDGYSYYISGKYKKAIKKYNGLKDKLTSYEKRLLEYMKKGEVCEALPRDINTFSETKKLKGPSTELFPMLLSWVILTPVWGIIYSLIFYIALYFLSKGSIYIGGADPFMVFLPAMLTSIINSFFTRKIMYKLLFRKNYNKIIALDEIENTSSVMNIMSKIFQFIIAIGIVCSVLAANTNISFYENSFKDNLDFLDIQGQVISYADVDCVYKADGIRNDFGYVVNNPTYVIVLKGGKQISLYYAMEFNDIKENVIPIFESHNIEIRDIDLVDNIENDMKK